MSLNASDARKVNQKLRQAYNKRLNRLLWLINKTMLSMNKKPQGNPQGKGAMPLLAAWDKLSPSKVEVKSADQILSQYFTSLLILSAEFHFKPVPHQDYYLYENAGDPQLTMISPDEWAGPSPYGACLAKVRQLGDLTWDVQQP